jgi:hypothetical protein
MNLTFPPPVIDSARVLSYAFVHDIPYRRAGALYCDERLVEHVPRLAICVNIGEDIGPLLYHCDEEWNVLGTVGAESVDALKAHAEKNYPGANSRWVDVNTTVEEALAHYDAETGGLKCSFCGRRPFEVDTWVRNKEAIICRGCVERLHHNLHNDPADQSGS